MTDSTDTTDTTDTTGTESMPPPTTPSPFPRTRAAQYGLAGQQDPPGERTTELSAVVGVRREELEGQPVADLAGSVASAEQSEAMRQVVVDMATLLSAPVEQVLAVADQAAGSPVSPESGKHLFTAAVDVTDLAAEAAHNAFFEGELPESGVEREIWRNVARAVREAVKPYTYPTADAYEAACKALENHRQGEKDQYARAYQLASLAQELYGRLRAREGDYWATTGDRIPEAAQDYLDDIRQQLDSTLCTGQHAEGEPCIDFRSAS